MNIHPSILPDKYLLRVVPHNDADPTAGIDIVIVSKDTAEIASGGYIMAITPEGIVRYASIQEECAKELNIPLNDDKQIQCDEMEGV